MWYFWGKNVLFFKEVVVLQKKKKKNCLKKRLLKSINNVIGVNYIIIYLATVINSNSYIYYQLLTIIFVFINKYYIVVFTTHSKMNSESIGWTTGTDSVSLEGQYVNAPFWKYVTKLEKLEGITNFGVLSCYDCLDLIISIEMTTLWSLA